MNTYGICEQCGEYDKLHRDSITLQYLCEACESGEEIEDEWEEDDE